MLHNWKPYNEPTTPFDNGDSPLFAKVNSRAIVIADGTGFNILIDNEYEHAIQFNQVNKLEFAMKDREIEEVIGKKFP